MQLADRAVAMLAAVHAHPGLTRAEASRLLGIGTGGAAQVVGTLVGARLLAEGPPSSSAARGRPTRQLTAHPEGPVVLAAAISHAAWRVDAVELGGTSIDSVVGLHPGGTAPALLAQVEGAVGQLRDRLGDRVQGLGVSAPGVVVGERFLEAVGLGWSSVDLAAIWPGAALLVADNDATLAALAEFRRGAAVDARATLHLRIDAGLGGAVIDAGRLVGGARGTAGEFGHLPLGDPTVRCACGARGCWGTAVDGGAMARSLGEPLPADPGGYARRVIARAADGEDAAVVAVRAVAVELGRGLGGLVNALDPDVVTLGDVAADLFTAAPEELTSSYREGLMEFRRESPPPVLPAALGELGPLVGAAERVWDRWWTQLRR